MPKSNNTRNTLIVVFAFIIVASLYLGIEKLTRDGDLPLTPLNSTAVPGTVEPSDPLAGLTKETCMEKQFFQLHEPAEQNETRSFFHCPPVDELYYGEILVLNNRLDDIILICETESQSIFNTHFETDEKYPAGPLIRFTSAESFTLEPGCLIEFVVNSNTHRQVGLSIISFQLVE